MLQTFNLPLLRDTLAEYGGWAGLRQELAALGLDGIEGIWAGEDLPPDLYRNNVSGAADLLVGYHLTFFPDWLDFYLEDKRALREKFGSLEIVRDFYGGWGAEYLLDFYRRDLARARQTAAKYLVFHVSDVSVEEGFTYRWRHSNAEVIAAAAELINILLADCSGESWEFLVENQWWPGFTFTEPERTEELLAAINYPRKGIMLDIGHLMNCNTNLGSQAEGADFVRKMLDRHGGLCQYIRGVHLHQSGIGAFVRLKTGVLPQDWPGDYWRRYALSYEQVLQIDRHLPWTDAAILPVLERIAPAYLTHELSAANRLARQRAVGRQVKLLRGESGAGQ